MARRFEKSGKNKILFGVAGGVAEYFKVDPVIVRVIFILAAFASGVGVLVYLLLALIMPKAGTPVREPLAVLKENLKAAPQEATEAGRRVVQVLRGAAGPERSGDQAERPEDRHEESAR